MMAFKAHLKYVNIELIWSGANRKLRFNFF